MNIYLADERVTKPNDLDLDTFINNFTLTGVTMVETGHIWYSGKGSEGFGMGLDGTFMALDPSLEYIYSGHLTFNEGTPPDYIDFCYQRMMGWRDTKTRLRLLGKPNSAFSLVENENCWLPLPRGEV